MRQRDEIEGLAGASHAKTAANHLVEFAQGNELRDRQFANRNNKPRLQDFELASKPRRTVRDFLRIRHAVTSARRFSGKTANDGGEINPGTDCGLVQPGGFLKPSEERFPRGMCEGALQHRLSHARRLADQHHITHNRATGNRRRHDPRAAAALAQSCHVPLQTKFSRRAGHRFLIDNSNRFLQSVGQP